MTSGTEPTATQSQISWLTVCIGVSVIAVLLGYVLTWLENLARSAESKGKKSALEKLGGYTSRAMVFRALKCNPLFRIFVPVWHFAVALLEFEPRPLGLAWRGLDEKSIREREGLLLSFFWHFAVLLPMFVVLLVSYFLKVEKEELYLFFCVAAATASLEICIGVLIRKSERINTLSQQTTLARERFDGVVLKNWILFFQVLHREARHSLAKAAYVTGLSLVLFSSIAVLETLRMKQAAGLTAKDIADVLEKHVQSKLVPANTSQDAAKTLEPGNDKTDDDAEEIRITMGSQSCGYSFDQAAVKLKEAHEEARRKEIGNDKAVFSIMCAVVMLLLAGRKAWLESKHADDRNPLDVYTTSLDALVVLSSSRYRLFITDEEQQEIAKQREAVQSNGHG